MIPAVAEKESIAAARSAPTAGLGGEVDASEFLAILGSVSSQGVRAQGAAVKGPEKVSQEGQGFDGQGAERATPLSVVAGVLSSLSVDTSVQSVGKEGGLSAGGSASEKDFLALSFLESGDRAAEAVGNVLLPSELPRDGGSGEVATLEAAPVSEGSADSRSGMFPRSPIWVSQGEEGESAPQSIDAARGGHALVNARMTADAGMGSAEHNCPRDAGLPHEPALGAVGSPRSGEGVGIVLGYKVPVGIGECDTSSSAGTSQPDPMGVMPSSNTLTPSEGHYAAAESPKSYLPGGSATEPLVLALGESKEGVGKESAEFRRGMAPGENGVLTLSASQKGLSVSPGVRAATSDMQPTQGSANAASSEGADLINGRVEASTHGKGSPIALFRPADADSLPRHGGVGVERFSPAGAAGREEASLHGVEPGGEAGQVGQGGQESGTAGFKGGGRGFLATGAPGSGPNDCDSIPLDDRSARAGAVDRITQTSSANAAEPSRQGADLSGAVQKFDGAELASPRETVSSQIVRQMSFHLNQRRDGGEVIIVLHPKELGHVRADLMVEDGKVRAQFLAETTVVKHLIDAEAAQLRSGLEKHGLML